MNRRPRRLIILAVFMLLAGVIIPFLIIIQLVESTFLINFAAFAVSVAGLFLGVLGIAGFVDDARRQNDEDEWPDEWRKL